MTKMIDIVFDGPPGPESGRFVEVEDENRHGLGRGEWIERDDGYWVLRIPDPTELEAEVERLEKALYEEQKKHAGVLLLEEIASDKQDEARDLRSQLQKAEAVVEEVRAHSMWCAMDRALDPEEMPCDMCKAITVYDEGKGRA